MPREKPRKAKTIDASRRERRPPRTRLETDERRAQLLQLGLSLFANRAYDEVSIDDLARAAGVSKGLVYHYFPTKRDLYVAGLREAARQLLDKTMVEVPGLSPIEQMRRSVAALLEYVAQHALPYTALMRGGIGSDPEVARIIEETRAVYVNRILDNAEGIPMGVAPSESPLLRLALRGWVGYVETLLLEWAEKQELPAVEVRDLIIDSLLAISQVATVRKITKGW